MSEATDNLLDIAAEIAANTLPALTQGENLRLWLTTPEYGGPAGDGMVTLTVDGQQRFYFASGGTSYFGAPANSEWRFRRNSDGLDALTLTSAGAGTFFSSGTPAYDSNFQPIPERITFPSLGYIPLIMWQMRYFGRSVGGGYWWPITAENQYFGAATPTTEQANYQGGYIIMADGFFDFGNVSGVDATVRYVIFHTQV